ENPQMRPRGFRIDMVRSHRRYATPIVDARVDKLSQRTRTEIRRRLDVHRGLEHEACNCDAPQMLFERRRTDLGHACPGLRSEVLDDDLLNVTETIVEVAQFQESIDAFRARLADADQHATREGNARFACEPDGLKPGRRTLVGRTVMRP